jgi:chromosome segregation ATPase
LLTHATRGKGLDVPRAEEEGHPSAANTHTTVPIPPHLVANWQPAPPPKKTMQAPRFFNDHEEYIPERIQREIEREDIENHVRQQEFRQRYKNGQEFGCMPPSAASALPSSSGERQDFADALTRRVLAERDDAVRRATAAESAIEEATARADHALEERNEAGLAAARAERAAHEAIMEREELEDELMFARNLLADASMKNRALMHRVAQLERWREVASHVLDAQVEPPPPPPASEADAAFGLSRTKEAIEKAVKDAMKLPLDERKKKLKLLKAKWHPDKHEVLKEMAEEVSKMINSCIDECGGEDQPAPDEGDNA